MIEDFYNTATLKRPDNSNTNDSHEYTPVYDESSINCYIGTRTNMEQPSENYGKFTIRNQYRCFSDTELYQNDYIVYKGENYRVIDDSQNTVDLDHHYKTYVEKIEGVN